MVEKDFLTRGHHIPLSSGPGGWNIQIFRLRISVKFGESQPKGNSGTKDTMKLLNTFAGYLALILLTATPAIAQDGGMPQLEDLKSLYPAKAYSPCKQSFS